MDIKIQSNSISFKEFAEQHPDSILIPDSHGLDGTLLFQILLPFVLGIIKDIIAYIAKKSIENKESDKAKAESIVIVIKNGKAIRIPLADFGDTESVLRRIENEVNQVTD